MGTILQDLRYGLCTITRAPFWKANGDIVEFFCPIARRLDALIANLALSRFPGNAAVCSG